MNVMPLFFQQPKMAQKDRHKDTSIYGVGYKFAHIINSTLVNVLEWTKTMNRHQIVFTARKKPMPVALVCLERNNYFVNPNRQRQKGFKLFAEDDNSYVMAQQALQACELFYEQMKDLQKHDLLTPRQSDVTLTDSQVIRTNLSQPIKKTGFAVDFLMPCS